VFHRVFLIFGIAFTALVLASAATADTPDVGGKVTFTIAGNGGNDEGEPGPSQCPQYEIRNVITVIDYSNQDPTTEKYGYFEYRCHNTDPWTRVWGCTANCVATPLLVLPPNPKTVEDDFAATAPLPDAHYAPPAELPDVAAITGLKLYAALTPETSTRVISERAYAGPWKARGILTPKRLTLTVEGVNVECTALTFDLKSHDGREQSDCFVPITDVPEGGRANVQLTVIWEARITSNVPGMRTRYNVTKTTTLTIAVKELQAVVEK
jgi:hypothetical protein